MLSNSLKKWGGLALAAVVFGELTRHHQGPSAKNPLDEAKLPDRAKHAHVEDPKTFYAGMPESSRRLTILTNCGFYIGYDEERHEAAWVAYHLRKVGNVGENIVSHKRPAGFHVDKRTKSKIPGSFLDKSGYDNGHLAPSDAIDVNFGPNAQWDTFSMPNVIVEIPEFNRIVVKRTESLEENQYANAFEDIWIITGPNISPNEKTIKKGKNSMPVPQSIYRIWVDEDRGRPRILPLDIPQNASPTNELKTYLSTLDALQRKNGIVYFPKLPRDLRQRLENVKPDDLWEVKKETKAPVRKR